MAANPLDGRSNDISYRKEQLRRLQDEMIELEDLKTGVSITDLGLNDFRMAKAKKIANLLTNITRWLRQFLDAAEQLTGLARWRLILSRIFQDFGRFPFDPAAPQAQLT